MHPTKKSYRRYLTAAAALLLGFISAAILASAAKSPAPRQSQTSAAAAIQPLAYFVGQWNCDGHFTSNNQPISATITAALDLQNSWLNFRWDDKAPSQFHALELWGFNKTAKQFTNFTYDNFGGVRMFTSPGWDGDTLTWLGDALADPNNPNQRFVIARKSSKEFVITWQTHQPQGDWRTGDELTCKQ
jgi:hypothetical protein